MRIPTFYYHGTGIGAVFPARLAALRRVMSDPRFTPARLAPGLGAVGLLCFKYRDSDIGPYSEVSISVALNDPWSRSTCQVGRCSRVRRRQLHGWVQHLAVTSELARDTGADIYNLPRLVGQIDTIGSARERVCRLSDGDEHILMLSVQQIPMPRSGRSQFFAHGLMDRQPQRAELASTARC